jgi:hypothetical protein
MYEHRTAPLLPPRGFARRLVLHGLAALGVVAVSLAVGVVGYHYLGELSWVDALLNAAMILGGMGPVDPLRSVAAKLFASFYALFSGVVFLATAAILMAPLVHRLLHRFHLESGHGER